MAKGKLEEIFTLQSSAGTSPVPANAWMLDFSPVAPRDKVFHPVSHPSGGLHYSNLSKIMHSVSSNG